MERAILYFPINDNASCSVYRLLQRSQKSPPIYKFTRIFSSTTYYTFVVYSDNPKWPEVRGRKAVQQLICFGVIDTDFPVLKSVNSYISPDWFVESFDISVLFIRNGNLIFENEKWKNVFTSWLTFSDIFEVNIEYKDFNEIQSSMYEQIQDRLSKCKSVMEVKAALENIYSTTFDKTMRKCKHTGVNVSDLLTAALQLIANKSAIVYG